MGVYSWINIHTYTVLKYLSLRECLNSVNVLLLTYFCLCIFIGEIHKNRIFTEETHLSLCVFSVAFIKRSRDFTGSFNKCLLY